MPRPLYRIIAALLLVMLFPALAHGRSPATAHLLNCVRFTTAHLPKPAPQANLEAIKRFQQINQEIPARPHAIRFLGDSLTQKWDAAVWSRYLAPLGALNEGVNGDRTEHLLWRLEHGNLGGAAPKAIVLLIGTNDVGRNRPPAEIAEGIRDILLVLRSRFEDARILLLGVLPRGEAPNTRRRRQVEDVNRLIAKCRDGTRVFYADLGSVLLDAVGRLSPAVSPDGVHLSRRGYALLTARLETELRRLGISSPKPVSADFVK